MKYTILCLALFCAMGATADVLIDDETNNGGFVSVETGFNGAPPGWSVENGVWIGDSSSDLDTAPFGADDAADSRFVQIHNDAGEILTCAQRMSVEPSDTVELSFDYRTGGDGNDATLTVELWDAEAGASYAVLDTLSTSADQAADFVQVDCSTTADAASDNIFLRFRLSSPGGLSKDFHIDRVHLAGASFPPPPPPVEYSTIHHLTAEENDERIIEKAAKTLPRPTQVAWQELEQTYFIHFGVNTFSGNEWGSGNENPDIFNPTAFDAEQWVREIDSAGGGMVILTVKHHDGFCLWPSRYTDHDVASSSWMGGQGDVLRAVSDACRKYGVKLGIYLSPADLFQIGDESSHSDGNYYGNHSPAVESTIPTDPTAFVGDPSQGRTPPEGRSSYSYVADDYNRYFLNQLYELCTEYGPIAEMWFDGANPKPGYDQNYSYADYYDLINRLQPEAVIAVGGPDVRWVGNENGIARETEWSVLPFSSDPRDGGGRPNSTASDIGSRDKLSVGSYLWWYPAECDTKILSGWFWNASHSVRDTSTLLDIYYASVGRNANLLLNLSPDTRGLIPDRQLDSLRPFGQIVRNTFAVDLADGADVIVPAESLGPGELLLDGDTDSFWEAAESTSTARITLQLPQEETFDVVALQEAIADRGQRIEGFTIETWNGSGWEEQARGTTVGYKRLMRLDSPVSTAGVRVNITACRLNPALAELSLHKQAIGVAAPTIGSRDSEGKVALANSDGLPIRYTLDGSTPGPDSDLYTAPLDMRLGGTIKAASIGADGLPGIIASRAIPNIAPLGWTTTADSAASPSANAVDDDGDTYWQSDASAPPHRLVIDLGQTLCIAGFTYQPPADGGSGTVKRYRVETSRDGSEWTVRAEGEFGNIVNSPVLQQVSFDPVMVRYLRFTALEEINGENTVKAAEIGVLPGGFDNWRRANALQESGPLDDPDADGVPALID